MRKYAQKKLKYIFNRTHGDCHLCGLEIDFSAYGDRHHSGGWEVDHSNPKSKGGSDYLRNLLPAHINCNRLKSNYSTREARNWFGRTRKPKSLEEKLQTGILWVLGIGFLYLLTQGTERAGKDKTTQLV